MVGSRDLNIEIEVISIHKPGDQKLSLPTISRCEPPDGRRKTLARDWRKPIADKTIFDDHLDDRITGQFRTCHSNSERDTPDYRMIDMNLALRNSP